MIFLIWGHDLFLIWGHVMMMMMMMMMARIPKHLFKRLIYTPPEQLIYEPY